MGCCDSELDHSTRKRKSLELWFDMEHYLMASYNRKGAVFKKINYDWYSIPIMNPLDLNTRNQFQITNRGIHNESFLAGIIKRKAVNLKVRTPWKTGHVLCYESHKNDGESGIVSEGVMSVCGRGVANGQTLTVSVGAGKIKFRVGDEILGSSSLPLAFETEEVLPYVTLFSEGDSIEFSNQKLPQSEA